MKQVLFVLFLFISFQGLAQESVKIQEIGLEIMKNDLVEMRWDEAIKACANLGDGWRLPTKDELKEICYIKDKVVGLRNGTYWSSTENSTSTAWTVNFGGGCYTTNQYKTVSYYVRAVRDL